MVPACPTFIKFRAYRVRGENKSQLMGNYIREGISSIVKVSTQSGFPTMIRIFSNLFFKVIRLFFYFQVTFEAMNLG